MSNDEKIDQSFESESATRLFQRNHEKLLADFKALQVFFIKSKKFFKERNLYSHIETSL